LISSSARAGSYGSAQGTQMDASEAVAQLEGARDLGRRLGDVAKAGKAHALTTHDAARSVEKFIDSIDAGKLGKHEAPVNGQEAKKAQGRTLADPVEAFATPVVLLDTPSTAAFASAASIASFSGQDLSLVAQGAVHQTAAHTYAGVSGQTTSLFTHAGGIKAFAASGPVSLRAHTDTLQIRADKDVTVVSVNDEIRIQASTKIEIVAGQSSVVLEGSNITFTCPGKFEVKGSGHAFLGGANGNPVMPALPIDLAKLKPDDLLLDYKHGDGLPVQGAPYKVLFADGSSRSGTLDGAGRALLAAVPLGYATVHYGEDARKAPLGRDEANPLKGWME
jgi:type VI secretion system secreted protein VgrG